MRVLMLGVCVGMLLAGGSGWASEMAILQGDDGSHGTLYDFGAVKLYNDSRGTTGTIYDFGNIQRYQFNNPSGQGQSGTIYRFGSPQASPSMPAPQNTPLVPLFPVMPNTGIVQPAPVAPYTGPGNSMFGPGSSAGGMGIGRGR